LGLAKIHLQNPVDHLLIMLLMACRKPSHSCRRKQGMKDSSKPIDIHCRRVPASLWCHGAAAGSAKTFQSHRPTLIYPDHRNINISMDHPVLLGNAEDIGQ
jgi:hypothetical protein